MCSILICDSNDERRKEITDAIERMDLEKYMIDEYEIISGGSCENILLRQNMSEHNAKLAFIYAEPGDQYGVDAAGLIKRNHPDVKIVFVCESTQYIRELYNVDFIYRLQLPAAEDELASVFEKASKTGRWKDNEYITVKIRSNLVRLPLRGIFYFEKSYRKINIVSEEGIYSFYGKMEAVSEMLSDNFIRCHNSYIVNFDKVISLENNHLTFSKKDFDAEAKDRIPVSRTYYTDVRSRFSE